VGHAGGVCALIAWFGFCAPAAGQPILVDHQPHRYGGGASDTLFIASGQQVWQRVADDFVLSAPATVGSLVTWGFYHEDNPPAVETMRIRFLEARSIDGLPDESNVISEQSILNPTRAATGRIILTGIAPHEYRFQMDLPTPIALDGGRPYWLEFVQIGDVSTHFRWEYSLANGTGQAFINPFVSDWQHTVGSIDTSFQLIAFPEPASIGILGLGWIAITARGKKHIMRA
jgi:hypothetical protein